MANWRCFGDRMLYCHQSILKARWNCSNTAGFHHSTCGGGGGLLCSVRSSEYILRLGGRSVGVLKKGAPFSWIQRFSSSPAAAGVVVIDEGEGGVTTPLGPLPLGSAPCLMLPAGCGLVDQGGKRYKLVTMEVHEEDRDYYQFFSLMEKKVVKMRKSNLGLLLPWQRELLPPDEAICFGSSRGWLAFIHPRNCSLYLLNPFIHSYLPYLPLPPIQTLPCFISSVRHDFNVHSSSSSSSINNNNNIVTEFTIWSQSSPISSHDLSQLPFFKKITLSSAPSPFPSNHHHHHIDNENKYSSDCTVMVIQGYEENKLAFCRIGDTAWTALDGAEESYQDIIYFSKNQHFYALSTDHEFIEAWDLRNPASPKNALMISHLPPWVHPSMDIDQTRLRRGWSPDSYLVESSGELLMVVRYYNHNVDDNGNYQPQLIFQDTSRPKKTVMFDVYKLDFVNEEWLLLPSLGDRALFIGLNDSVSVSATDFPGLAMNCIYFTCPSVESSQDSHDLGIFNLEDNKITPIYQYDLEIQLPSPWVVPAQQ